MMPLGYHVRYNDNPVAAINDLDDTERRKAVDILLGAGADGNALSGRGKCLLSWAIEMSDWELLERLMKPLEQMESWS